MDAPEFRIEKYLLLKSDKSYKGKIEVPSGITVVCGDAFRSQHEITEIVLPNGVETIGVNAFMECTALTRIYIPDGVKMICSKAFFGCTALTRIYLPKSVKEINDKAFANCPNLTIYCEAEPTDGWTDITAERTSYYETEEDYAFNFHRSSGSWNRTAVTETIRSCWNPDARPVITNISRDKYNNN